MWKVATRLDALTVADKFSILGLPKLNVMQSLLLEVRDKQLVGHAAELGVYRGGVSYLIANTLLNKQVHMFDTWEGLPPTADYTNEYHKPGEFGDIVNRGALDDLATYKRVHFHEGIFPGSVPPILDTAKFCFVHLDADLYDSTKAGLEFFYPKMVKGGIIVTDDYLWPHCPGCATALHEFLWGKPEQIEVRQEFQAIIRKV